MACVITKKELTENLDGIIREEIFNSNNYSGVEYTEYLDIFLKNIYTTSLIYLEDKEINGKVPTEEERKKKAFSYSCHAVNRAFTMLTNGSFNGFTTVKNTNEIFPLFKYDSQEKEVIFQERPSVEILNELTDAKSIKSIVAQMIDPENAKSLEDIDICTINEALSESEDNLPKISSESTEAEVKEEVVKTNQPKFIPSEKGLASQMPEEYYKFESDVKAILLRNKTSKEFDPNLPLMVPFTDENGKKSLVEGEFVIRRVDNTPQLVIRYKKTGELLSKSSAFGKTEKDFIFATPITHEEKEFEGLDETARKEKEEKFSNLDAYIMAGGVIKAQIHSIFVADEDRITIPVNKIPRNTYNVGNIKTEKDGVFSFAPMIEIGDKHFPITNLSSHKINEIDEFQEYFNLIKNNLKTSPNKADVLRKYGFALTRILKGITINTINPSNPKIIIEKIISKDREWKNVEKEQITLSAENISDETLDKFFGTLSDSDLGKINAFVSSDNESLEMRTSETSTKYETSNPVLIKSYSKDKKDFTLKDLFIKVSSENKPLSVQTNLFNEKGEINKNSIKVVVLQDPSAERIAQEHKAKIQMLTGLSNLSYEEEHSLLEGTGIVFKDELGYPC